MLSEKLKTALAGDMTPKFLATCDANGKPNVVVISTMDAGEGDELIFGELMIWKTRRNLEESSRVCAAVITEQLDVWIIKGDFTGFAETGAYIDKINSKDMLRYNAYMGIRRVGVIKVSEITGSYKVNKISILKELVPILPRKIIFKLAGNNKNSMPVQVMEKFSRTQALKVLSFVGADGYPQIVPSFSLFPIAGNRLVFNVLPIRHNITDLQDNQPVAVNVITFDPISYQVKGNYSGAHKIPLADLGIILVKEVYSACPPLPGQRIDI